MENLTHSLEETEALGSKYAQTLSSGDVVTLDGELGAGKTAFARGILRGLGYTGRVTSPTFAIANEYDTPLTTVTHFDMYRIQNAESLWDIGFNDYLDDEHILLIEWSSNIINALPAQYKTVSITYGNNPEERIVITGEIKNENTGI